MNQPLKRLLVLAAPLLLAGCSTYTLNDARVQGPADAPLPRVADTVERGDVVIRPWFVFGDAETVRGEIGDRDDGTAQLEWMVPRHQAGATLDLCLSTRMALVLGVQYAQDDFDDYRGGSLGLALFEGDVGAVGWRLDVGAAWQEMAYSLDVVIDPPGSDPSTETLTDKTALLNTSAMLTLNSRRDGPVNVFLNGGFGTKTYFDYNQVDVSASSSRLDFSGRYAFWSPGVVVELDPRARVSLGARFVHPGEIRGDVGTFGQGFVQFDLSLGD
jgi:hypothetical protein